MDTPTLKAFLAVAETGSFSRAAERLHLTQPAVSKRIAALEQTLAARLFDRIGRTVTPTEAGRALLPHARRLLAEIADTRRAITNLSGNVGGRLNLGTSHHVGLHRLPGVLRRYARAYPAVELNLQFLGSETACLAVERGELELAVVTLPAAPPPSLAASEIWPDPLSIVVAADHPLARRKRTTPAQLVEFPAILPGTETYTRAIIDAAFRRLRLDLRVGPSTNYLETIKMMVTIGLGWSALPNTMIDTGQRVLAVEGIALKRALGVVRHTERVLSNAARALLETLETR